MLKGILATSIAVLAVLTVGLVPTLSADPPDGNKDHDEVKARQIAVAARTIDRMVLNRLGKNGVAPNAVVDDATFVRRAYLSIVGRIPTYSETTRFIASKKKHKRSALIDTLLASPGHTSHMFNFWADLLRIKSRLAGNVSGEPYIDWVKQAVTRNMPYDEFVGHMINASGPAYARGNGATGYFLRDRGMLADNMANTIRIFLGTRLECAQCHNHPFDKWTQMDFYKMTAFTGGLRFRHELSMSVEGRRLLEMRKNIEKDKGRQAARSFDRMVGAMTVGLNGDGNGTSRLPHDYMYDDAKPRQSVSAEAILSDPEPEAEGQSPKKKQKRGGSREEYARWLTSPENPRFTTVIANRMWKRIMGSGLIEPVDIITDATVPSNPELMTYLEKLMREVDYDLIAFQRVIYNTQTFQRAAVQSSHARDGSTLYPGPKLQRMSAEQIWDSMLTLVVDRVDEPTPGGSEDRAENVYQEYENISQLEEEDVEASVGMDMMRRMDRKMYEETMRKREAKARAEQRKKARENRPILRELKKARKRGDEKTEAKLVDLLMKKGVKPPPRPGRSKERDLMRAAELPSPVAPGHALRQFGQSDRDQIDASTREANIPQVLMLINGFIEDAVLEREDSVIMKIIESKRGAHDKVRAAYLSILNREPTKQEAEMWRADAKRHGKTAWKDLVWSLLNTHEFMFVQ